MQTFSERSSKKCETKILSVLRFEIAFEIDASRFNLFSTLLERAFKQVSLIESWRFVLCTYQFRRVHSRENSVDQNNLYGNRYGS